MMEQLIQDMIERMCQIIETSVPEDGDFEPLREGFDNPDKDLVVNRFWLEVMQPPEGIQNRAWVRGLKFKGDRPEYGVVGEILLVADTKEVLLQKMRNPAFLQELLELTKKISYNLRGL